MWYTDSFIGVLADLPYITPGSLDEIWSQEQVDRKVKTNSSDPTLNISVSGATSLDSVKVQTLVDITVSRILHHIHLCLIYEAIMRHI